MAAKSKRSERRQALELDRSRIANEADPIGFLMDVMKGKRCRAAQSEDARKFAKLVFPTLKERIEAARILAGKTMPDLKSIDVDVQTGDIVVERVVFGSQPKQIEASKEEALTTTYSEEKEHVGE